VVDGSKKEEEEANFSCLNQQSSTNHGFFILL